MAQALMDGAGVSLPGGEKLGDCVTSSGRSQLFLPFIIYSKNILFEKSTSLSVGKEPGTMFAPGSLVQLATYAKRGFYYQSLFVLNIIRFFFINSLWQYCQNLIIYSQDSEIRLILICDTEDWLFLYKHITTSCSGPWVSQGEKELSSHFTYLFNNMINYCIGNIIHTQLEYLQER